MSHVGFHRTFIAAFLGVFALTSFVGNADAGKRKRRKAKPAAVGAASVKVTTGEHATELGKLMGEYKFGMESKAILKILGASINESFEEKIKATTDVYQQDKLRRTRDGELARIKKSYVDFKGVKGGWDVSIVDDQFAHNAGVSMLVHWENEGGVDQRRFFFFKDGKLYKMFIALNSKNLKPEQKNFDFFKGLMEAKYGAGKVVLSKDLDGVERPMGIEWRTAHHHVSALDKLNFYGSFCLVIADPAVEKDVIAARDAALKAKVTNTAMKSVVIGDKDDDTPGLDENKAAVDAILNN
jgi:hypothetical protein